MFAHSTWTRGRLVSIINVFALFSLIATALNLIFAFFSKNLKKEYPHVKESIIKSYKVSRILILFFNSTHLTFVFLLLPCNFPDICQLKYFWNNIFLFGQQNLCVDSSQVSLSPKKSTGTGFYKSFFVLVYISCKTTHLTVPIS